MPHEPHRRSQRILLWSLLLLLAFPAAIAQSAAPAGKPAAQVVYSGNPKTMKYHNASCRYFTCKACTVRFSSPDEARGKGYVACKVCRG